MGRKLRGVAYDGLGDLRDTAAHSPKHRRCDWRGDRMVWRATELKADPQPIRELVLGTCGARFPWHGDSSWSVRRRDGRADNPANIRRISANDGLYDDLRPSGSSALADRAFSISFPSRGVLGRSNWTSHLSAQNGWMVGRNRRIACVRWRDKPGDNPFSYGPMSLSERIANQTGSFILGR